MYSTKLGSSSSLSGMDNGVGRPLSPTMPKLESADSQCLSGDSQDSWSK
jgi:hypothetical protein